MNYIEELLTQHDYAKVRRCSVRTLQRERMRGDGCEFIKIGRHVRYRRADILRFVRAHRRRSIIDDKNTSPIALPACGQENESHRCEGE
jgi:hypothetical protein